jgi:hypothetical protein
MTMSLQGLPVLVEVFWKSGVILGAALCVNGLLQRRSADVRRLVLSSAIVAMFAAALAMPLLPRWTPKFGSPAPSPAASSNTQPAIADGATELLAPVIETTLTESASGTLPGAIPLIWFLGTALFFVRFAAGLRGLHRLRVASQPVSDARFFEDDMDTGSRPGRVALMRNDSIAAPLT